MSDKATIVVHSGDMDKLYSALIIGNGALAMGMEATLYFTFWGLLRLTKGGSGEGASFQNAHAGDGKAHDQAADGQAKRGFAGKADEGLQGTGWQNHRLRDDDGDHGRKSQRFK